MQPNFTVRSNVKLRKIESRTKEILFIFYAEMEEFP